jgi:hypothetical protein
MAGINHDLSVSAGGQVGIEIDVLHAAGRIDQGETLGQDQIGLIFRKVGLAGDFGIGPPGVDARAVVGPEVFPAEQPAVHPVIADSPGGTQIQGPMEQMEAEGLSPFLKVNHERFCHRFVLVVRFLADRWIPDRLTLAISGWCSWSHSTSEMVYEKPVWAYNSA